MSPSAPVKKSGNASGRRATTSRTGKKSSGGWLRWWPVLLGLAITPFAVKTAEILPLTGAGGLLKLRLLYPFAMLLKEHAFGLHEAARETLAHALLYAQFPLYGLYAVLVMKWKSWRAAFFQVALLHLAGFGLLWFLAQK